MLKDGQNIEATDKKYEGQDKIKNGIRGQNLLERWRSSLPSKESIDQKIESTCGFRLEDISSFEKITQFLYRPTDPASLGVARALFGLCMVIDVVEERGFADIDIKWGDPNECHFPLIHGMKPPALPWMIVIYTIMWFGAFGIMLGYRLKLTCACFVIPYWYIFLLDKSYWNNHTYLYGLVATLFWGTQADKYFALNLNRTETKEPSVPFWNYFIIKFQFFILYFLAGLKKSSREWLEGYSMTNLSKHWVFDPFKIFLTTEQTDFFIVHWFGFIFDLTVGFWMLFDKTRIPAMVFCTAFHLMNSRLFSIGMFPFVCLATMPLFCHVDWPRNLLRFLTSKCVRINEKIAEQSCPVKEETLKNHDDSKKSEKSNDKVTNSVPKENCGDLVETSRELNKKEKLMKGLKNTSSTTKKQKFVVSLLFVHAFLQFFLPYSHFLTKGYNNWTPGLYGYSWDMMVYAWETVHVVINVRDNVHNRDNFLGSDVWVQTDRWMKHGDMARQYTFCLKDNLMREKHEVLSSNDVSNNEKMEFYRQLSTNISIYMDVWTSLNGRFQQRLFNPYVDMLTVEWSPLKPVTFLLPLLTQYNSYRYKLEEIQQHVYSWSNYTDVLFIADFPGMHLENYIIADLTNVSLTVLEGDVVYSEKGQSNTIALSKGQSVPVKTEIFHTISTVSLYPACYMYTYTNQTREQQNTNGITEIRKAKDPLPIMKELKYKAKAWIRTFSHITNAFFNLVYNVPMVRRVRVN
ncbi:vitamin K-dependent gamma-carboxylase [Prorops nasuta]|uniref:vitamin K-dependent gamma-carboxylase n=1 Tax=Prorops nasuta TaxID=863751 RepID=UPI0034CE9D75